MSGIFGVASKTDCANDLFWGTHYLQHRAQDFCGLALDQDMNLNTHHGLLKQQFSPERLSSMKGKKGIGFVSGVRQPISELSRSGGMVLGYDGNIINYKEIKDRLLREGSTFSGYASPEKVTDNVLISNIIARETSFQKGIEALVEQIKGDFAIISLTREGIYASRGWGRKPLILGKKNNSYAVASESNSFVNNGFAIVRDVKPGEIVFIDDEGIHEVAKLDLQPVKYGTFEWIYTSHPASTIDGRNVAEVRKNLGKLLARRYPQDADVVSPVPNSGRWHAIGYAEEAGIPYAEIFIRYDYSDRSYTPGEQEDRDKEAKTKLIPVEGLIRGKRIILVDDSIVRGTQTLNQVKRLREEFGVLEAHARIACPPLMSACTYGKTTKKDEDCIARRMPVDEIQEKLSLNSLGYATVEDLVSAIGYEEDKLCLDCWKI